jgi:catechol 2,3-dioxygenase-like lactoylglutathione lyase family enzyme
MRPHISLDARNVSKSVAFYEKVFGVPPQKQVADYAKFDLKTPALNFSLVSSSREVRAVDHLGIGRDGGRNCGVEGAIATGRHSGESRREHRLLLCATG